MKDTIADREVAFRDKLIAVEQRVNASHAARIPLPGSAQWLRHYRITPPGTPQPELHAELAAGGLSETDAHRAVVLWNVLMRGIWWQGGHRTALAILDGTLRHHRIPAVPEWRKEWLAPLEDAPRWKSRSWTTPAGVNWELVNSARDPGAWFDLASYDVNGSFLSAAATDLGTGAPVHQRQGGSTVEDARMLKIPGFVLLADIDPVPYWLGSLWDNTPTWYPNALVQLMCDQGVTALWYESLIWTEHRRWLAPHVDLFRDARTKLMTIGDDPAALALLSILKDCYKRAFGGLLNSTKDETNDHHPAINHGWGLQVPATAQARQLRAATAPVPSLDNRPAPLAAVFADAAWFITPTGRDVPLELSTQLGKWKRAGRLRWDRELAGLYQDGQVRAIAGLLRGDA